MDFAERLIMARKEKGISQESLAEQLGVSRQAISKWETGESKPDLSNLIALCNTLDMSLEYLCFGTVPSAETQACKKPYPLWTKILLITTAIIASVLLGTLAFCIVTETFTYREGVSQKQTVDIQNIGIVNANVTYNVDSGCYEISVTPSPVYEDIQMVLRIENLTDSSAEPFTALSTLENGIYKWIFHNPQKNIEYCITAVFISGEMQKQIPVMKFQAGEGNCGFEHLWEQTD